jgi:type IV conjugative transfer system coupling protein TraD
MFNNFIGGGQVFLHKLRMFAQVFFRTLHVSLFVGIILSCCFNWPAMQRLDWDAFYSYRKASFTLGWDNAFIDIRASINKDAGRITYINAKSATRSWENIDPYQVTRMSLFQKADKEGWNFIKNSLLIASWISIGSFILIYLLWSKFGHGLKDEKTCDGSAVVLTPEQVGHKLRSMRIASDFKIGKMPLVKDMETRHFLVTGSTGSGKTNLIHNLLPQIEDKKQAALVIDQTGEMIAKYYKPERGDIIFNPFDDRNWLWDFWADCSDDESLERFSNILMGFSRRASGTRSDPFWEKSATEIFESAVKYQRTTGDKSIENLTTLVRQTNINVLRQKLNGSAASRYLMSENGVTANSILSVLTTSTKPLSYLQDISEQKSFSLKEYFNGVQKGQNSWLFLATKPSNRQLTLPLIACLSELALAQLMDIGIDEKRRVWFVMDELAALGVLPGLSPLMTEGRKYGACVLAGLQSLNQLYEYYGHHAGSKIFGQFGTLCFFRNQEESIVRMISNMCGSETITRQQKNTSFGANEFRDGVSFTEQQTKKELVTQNDISSLAVGQCYMLLPEPNTRLVKVQTPKSEIKEKHVGFLQSTKLVNKEAVSTDDLNIDVNTGDYEWVSDLPTHTSDEVSVNNITDGSNKDIPATDVKKAMIY